jgi:hypothetical protein
MRRPFSWLMLGMACWLGSPSAARASCNSTPAASQVGSISPSPLGTYLGYRGDIGRINHVYLAQGLTPPVTISIDPKCAATDAKGHVDASRYVEGIDGIPADGVIVFVSSALPAARTQRVAVQPYASEALCNRINTAGQKNIPRLLSLEPCTSGAIEVTPGGTGIELHGVRFNDLPSPLRVLAVKAGNEKGAYLGSKGVAYKALTEGCAAAREECAAAHARNTVCGVYVCLDQIYLGTDKEPCKVAAEFLDPFGCRLVGLDQHEIFFRTQCTCDPNSPDCTANNCESNATTIDWYVDDCRLEGIHGLFNWVGVYEEGRGRRVAGSGAAGRASEMKKDKRIVIPGREFLGSTGAAPQNGEQWVPDFDVENGAHKSEESGLKGTVDKPTSILHVYPRVPVDRMCKIKSKRVEGCFAAPPPGPPPATPICPCASDQSENDCECVDVTPRFFACAGGDFAGMPCTRPKHCAGDVCGMAYCHKKTDAVWMGKSEPKDKVPCLTDENCFDDEQCGYSLFDFKTKGPKKRFVTLDHHVKANGPRKRRGVCPDRTPCSNGRNDEHCRADKKCTGYKLQARGVVTPTPTP